ncbi:EAL domain-containing protein [Enterovibrio sp. ZSDZ35]|uniref:EAL domain-containing protein n=1 Tax=Enterovibrio qingdaonensis TaxID=2899818 RepID=A0ABT5QHM3_9GAMM|nr:EAL domain-containing protein [Enterovibrio sp. ZSDZ35]MDD1780349.1 EAL domain-containing protein [Enterovibrio sp. ZSDZ35]
MKVCVAYTKDAKRNKIKNNLERASFYHESVFVHPLELGTLSDSDIVILYDSKYVANNAANISASISLLKANNNCVAVVLSCRQDDRFTGVTAQICRVAGADSIERIHNTFNAETLESVIQQALRFAQAKARILHDDSEDEQLLKAFKHGLVNYYQPQYNIRKNTIAAVEVLPRIRTTEGVLVYAYKRQPFIERNGLEHTLFFSSLRMAMLDMTLSSLDINLSINVSPTTLRDKAFYSSVADVLNEFRFSPKKLTLEINEHADCLASLDALINITNLRLLGVGFSIENFGNGVNPYGQLSSLPVTELKVSRSFVKKAMNHYGCQQIVFNAISVAQSLGLRCVAEGVEDIATLEYLKQNKVDYGQGRFLSKPVTITKLTRLISNPGAIRRPKKRVKKRTVVLLVDSRISRLASLKKTLELQSSHLTVLTASTHIKAKELFTDKLISFVICDESHRQPLEKLVTESPTPAHLFVLHENFVETRDPAMLYYKEASHLSAIKIKSLIENHLNLEKELGVLSRLSSQEKIVLNQIYQGEACKKIARDLDISFKTVSTYKTRIFQKLGVHNDIECVRLLSGFSPRAITLQLAAEKEPA